MSSMDFRPATEIVIPPEQVREFADTGVTAIRGLLDADGVERMRAAIERVLASEEFVASRAAGFSVDQDIWRADEDFRALAFASAGPAVAAALMQAEKVQMLFDHLLVKEPGSDAKTPWHQDLPYWNVDGRQLLTLWIALDPVTVANGGVEYVRGSHNWPQRYSPESFRGEEYTWDTDLPRAPDIDSARADYDIVSYNVAPGDCIAHQALTIHGAPGNATAATRRRAVAIRYAGPDVTVRAGTFVHHVVNKEGEVVDGAPLSPETFPVVYPSAA